jgi:hypothetical protein
MTKTTDRVRPADNDQPAQSPDNAPDNGRPLAGESSGSPQPDDGESFDVGQLERTPAAEPSGRLGVEDLAGLHLGDDLTGGLEVEEVVTTIRVGKPGRESYIRTHPDRNSPRWFRTCVLDLKDDREVWLVGKPLWPQLLTEPSFQVRLLVTSVTVRGEVFLWPLRLPGPDGRLDEWGQSALNAAETARARWLRVYTVPGCTGYKCQAAKGNLPDPRWPDLSVNELLNIAFRGRLINDPDHAVLKRLRGEA